LAGTVESDIAATIALEDFDAALDEELRLSEEVGGLGIASQGDGWWVFEEEQDVADLICLSQFDELLLQA